MLPTRSYQPTLQTFGSGSAQSQRTCGLLPTTVNDSVEVGIQINPRLTNAIHSRENNTSRLKKVKNMDSGDPHFNTPGKIHILLGADFLEDLLLDNEIKENGLVLRESFIRLARIETL